MMVQVVAHHIITPGTATLKACGYLYRQQQFFLNTGKQLDDAFLIFSPLSLLRDLKYKKR